ncbi:hypothetical protein BU24DRAFT_492970 [Aaosphaeria arxii CBS 175.79]|uniref:Uncharacterized protein n=1 Tax=Aaosphaeria arxii CBS 175.79 TaxID=1450172 RepID=A0A6A5XNJ8_9PLEO|nr:uncharacterized protein BU24DRAFT_492970 [Aaosphaeria arxii CBS 175.79]KAF2014310.1 hypothetical protein BU24DRAFT_492970 [Aaosphaeria arxii CBS 175.79]
MAYSQDDDIAGMGALHDLGNTRFDHDTAAIGDRDSAFFANRPIHVAKGVAPKGLEAVVFSWHALQYTTEDKDEKEELKGDLHGGQLHRANRAARERENGHQHMMMMHGGGGEGRRGGKKKGRGGPMMGMPMREGAFKQGIEGYTAAMKPPGKDVLPCAKGFPEELSKDLFWDGPIVELKDR